MILIKLDLQLPFLNDSHFQNSISEYIFGFIGWTTNSEMSIPKTYCTKYKIATVA